MEIKAQSKAVSENVRKQEFQRCVQQWERCQYLCMNSKGYYSDGDKTDL